MSTAVTGNFDFSHAIKEKFPSQLQVDIPAMPGPDPGDSKGERDAKGNYCLGRSNWSVFT